MSSKYTVVSSTASSSSALANAPTGMCHLSDGTLVALAVDETHGDWVLGYTTNRTSWNTIATLNQTGGTYNWNGHVTVCCDAYDNLYVMGDTTAISNTEGVLMFQAFTKGTGLTWTAQSQQTVLFNTPGGANTWTVVPQRMVWANIGGTNGAGWLVTAPLAWQVASGPVAYYANITAVDAGTLLAGTTPGVVQTTFGSGNGVVVSDIQNAGVGSTGGVAISGYTGNTVTANTWSINSSGVVTLTALGSGASMTSYVNFASQFWILWLGTGTTYAVIGAKGASSTGNVGAVPIVSGTAYTGSGCGTPTNAPPTMPSPNVAMFSQPFPAGKAWVLYPGSTSTSFYRIGATVSGTTLTWDTSVTADDTSVGSGTNSTTRAVMQPRAGYEDWHTFNTNSGTYSVLGDFSNFFTAPNAPTLTVPVNASYDDVSSGQSFTASYNSTDLTYQNAYACRIKTSGAGSYNYFNAGTNALQSTIIWNTVTTAPSASWTWTLPNTAITNGNIYNWSAASQEAGANDQGAFATDFTFTSQAAPVVSGVGPTGTATSATPIVSWTTTPAAGASQTAYQVIVESGSYGPVPGSGTQIWTSGTVASSAQSVTVGATLNNNVTYRAFVQATETGSELSNWAYATFTVVYDTPATPTVTATPGTDGTTGYPIITVTVQGHDNILSALDASFEGGLGTTAAVTNCTVTDTTAESEDGSYSMEMSSTAAGSMSAATAANVYSVLANTSYTVRSDYRSAVSARSVRTDVAWYTSSGSLISTSTGTAVTDTTTGWTTSSTAVTSPATAAYAKIVHNVLSTAAASEVHYVDDAGLFPGTVSTWSRGGLVGSTFTVITRSDGLQVRYASTANPATVPTPSQTFTIGDYEVPPGVTYTYSAVIQVIVSGSVTLLSAPGVSSGATLTTTAWWELDPTATSTAVSANPTEWRPVNTEQAAAHQVMGQPVLNIVSNVMLNQDFAGTFELFDGPTYTGFQALLVSQKTLFISSPWGSEDSGYFRVGPQSGGMSTGVGLAAKNTQLLPSTAADPHRTVQVTAVAAPRPQV